MEHAAAQTEAQLAAAAAAVPALRAPEPGELAARDPAALLRLQRTAGNAAVGRVLARELGKAEREDLRDLIRAGVAAPYMVDEEESTAAE